MSKQFANSNRAEYVQFCEAIINEYNSKHIDYMVLSDVLDTKYSYDMFYATYLVMR